jgi:uncharacterized protein (UPF0332 family)
MSSNSSLDKLVREGKLRPQKAAAPYLNDLLEAAHRNFEAARLLQGRVDEAAFKLYYDGLLQVSRAVLLLEGLRPDDGEQHKTTFLAAGMILGSGLEDLVRKIQKFRIKRNESIYDPRGLVGASEAQAIYQTARSFWKNVRAYLQKIDPQLKLFDDL